MERLKQGDEAGIGWFHEYNLGLMTSDSVFLVEAMDTSTSRFFDEQLPGAPHPTFPVALVLIDRSETAFLGLLDHLCSAPFSTLCFSFGRAYNCHILGPVIALKKIKWDKMFIFKFL